MKRSIPIILFIISTALSIELQCKKWRKEVCFDSNIIVTEKETSIQPILNDATSKIIKTLFLKEATIHVLPVNISVSFPDLKILKIINSSLTEIEKSDFTGLDELLEVNFELNKISNLPVDVFSYLESISKINLNFNNISAIPGKLFTNNLKLTEISFIGNQIEQLHDQTFKNLVNLKFIFLSHNNIEDLRGGTFDDCKELEVISIDNNKLKYAPKNIFDQNKKIKFSKRNFIKNKCIDSYLESNSMARIGDLKDAFEDSCKPYNQEYIDELNKKIKELEGDVNNLNKELKTVYKEVENAKKNLSGKNQELKDLQAEKDEFDSKLRAKDDEISKLTEEIQELTKNLDSMSSTSSICTSNLKSQESDNSQLKSDLNTCKTQHQDCNNAKKVTLKELGIEAVRCHQFETMNQNLTEELKILRLEASEKDKFIESVRKTIEESDRKLKINEFFINSILNGYAEANKTIEVLSSKSCSTKSLTPIAELDNPNFFNIDCKFEENSVKNDKFYTCGVNDVRALDCNSKLKEISSNSNGKTVAGISFTDSYMINFPTDLVKNFENFKYFKISKSVFGKFVENVCELSDEIEILSVTSSVIGESIKLDDCKALKSLQIESSGLKLISAENSIKSLTNIALKGNRIEEISKDFFDKFENLKSIQMPENKIAYLDENTFDGNKHLEVVNLSKNPIKKINGEIFTQNSKLVSVDFRQLGCINKAEYSKNKMSNFKVEISSKCN